MRRKLLLLISVVLVLGTAIVLAVPPSIRWYVTRTYPFVTLHGDLDIGWDGLTFHTVSVRKRGIEGSFNLVHVTPKKAVMITGGNVTVDLDAGTEKGSEGPGASMTIQASGLSAEVQKGEVRASIEGMRVDGSEVCFDRMHVTRKDMSADVAKGCVQRDKSGGSAKEIRVPIEVPFHIPRVKTQQVVTIQDAEVDPSEQLLRFNSLYLGPFKVKGPATVKLADGTIYLDAPEVQTVHPWVSPHEAHFKELSVTVPLKVLRGEKGKFRIRVGRTTVFLDLENYSLDGDATCNEWLDILPHPLPGALADMEGHYTGSLRFEVRAKPTPYLKIKHDCKFDCSREPIKSLRKRLTTYMAYDKDGGRFERKTGPNSAGWVGIGDLPPFVPRAFITMEDPGFYHHHGIHVQALENSLKMNLATGKFVRGGSTISMQLAKNLWLRRHKTVGRKAYEALLTVALEACLTKAEILELYVNVVEYGPDLYGIGPASKHYFDKPAQQLELDEAFYLASLLPRPKRALPPKAGGMDRVHRLMRSLANSGFISEHLVPVKDNETLDTAGWEIEE